MPWIVGMFGEGGLKFAAVAADVSRFLLPLDRKMPG